MRIIHVTKVASITPRYRHLCRTTISSGPMIRSRVGRNVTWNPESRRKILALSQRNEQDPPTHVSIFSKNVLLFFVFPAIGGMLFGYDIGATSGALLSMTSSTVSGTTWYALSTTETGLVVSLSLAGALLGSGLALGVGDSLGRKKELILGGFLYILGAGLVSQAPGTDAVGLTLVEIGRLLYGLGIGFSMHAAPAYIAETSPASVRGVLISTKEAFIVGGILLGYLVSYLVVSTLGGWRYIYGAAMPLGLVLMLGMAYLPESPRWLALKNKKSEALESLQRIQGGEYDRIALQEEVDTMINAAAEGGEEQGSSLLQEKYRKPLLVGLSLMLFQQITGQPSVLYYAAKIFQDAGFTSADSATGISVVLGLFKLGMTSVAIATVDSWGRRPLLLLGVSGIVVSLLVLGTIQSGDVSMSPDVEIWANVVALLVYVGAYQVSFGPISWLIVGEVFPLSIRGQALALATLTNFASNFVVSLYIPSLQESLGPSGLYFAFAGIGCIALYVIYSIVPETKGKSLEEIENMWSYDE
jgi:sugar porter (SP) family MFS transporter